MKRFGMAGLGLSLLFACMLAACAAAGAPTTDPVATPVPPGALGLFTGFQRCREDTTVPSASADPDVSYTVCDETASDPRLVGALKLQGTGTTNDEMGTISATGTLANDGGEWRCTELIVGSMKNATGGLDEVCVGAGGYVGLTAYIHGVTQDTAGTFGLFGWIDVTR
jgi:hypothetical protein